MKNVIAKFISRRMGRGVFAARDFRKGEVILPYQKSRIYKDGEVPKVWKGKFRYLDRVGKDIYMVMKSPERFVNSSCEPNVYIKNWKIIAMKPVKKGEQLLFDYSINSDFPVAFKCRCGAKNCRGMYSKSFFKLPRRIQKKYLPYLDAWFKRLYRKELAKLK